MDELVMPQSEPDTRSVLYARDFQDMERYLEGLDIGAGLSHNVGRAFETMRELLRFSFYRYEFAAVAAFLSIIEVESILNERYPRKTLEKQIEAAQVDHLVSVEQADLLNVGRRLRNRYAHGEMEHPALPFPLVARIIRASLELATALQKESSQSDPA